MEIRIHWYGFIDGAWRMGRVMGAAIELPSGIFKLMPDGRMVLRQNNTTQKFARYVWIRFICIKIKYEIINVWWRRCLPGAVLGISVYMYMLHWCLGNAIPFAWWAIQDLLLCFSLFHVVDRLVVMETQLSCKMNTNGKNRVHIRLGCPLSEHTNDPQTQYIYSTDLNALYTKWVIHNQ